MPLRGCIPSLVRTMRSTEVQRQAPSFATMLSPLACSVPIARRHAPELSRRMDSYHSSPLPRAQNQKTLEMREMKLHLNLPPTPQNVGASDGRQSRFGRGTALLDDAFFATRILCTLPLMFLDPHTMIPTNLDRHNAPVLSASALLPDSTPLSNGFAAMYRPLEISTFKAKGPHTSILARAL